MRQAPPRRAALSLLTLCLITLLGALGCAGDLAPDLLNVVDVVPRIVDAGDRLEILGNNLPTGEKREAVVVFEGELRRAGQPPLTRQRIEIDRAQMTGDRVSLRFNESLQGQFCGQGDEAIHTTFRGKVTVRVASVGRGALEVKGTVEGVEIDFVPPTPRRAIIDARNREGSRALEYLGIAASNDTPPAGGLLINAVRPGSPANDTGLVAGDVIVAFEGVRVLSLADVIPSGHERTPEIVTQQGNGPLLKRTISVEAFKPSGSSDLLGAGILLGTAAGIILFFLLPTARILAWFERRVASRLRSGGRTLSPSDVIADAVRALLKEDRTPRERDRTKLRLTPYLVFIGVSATFVVMPFGQYLVATDLDIGVLFVIALTALLMIGLLTGGGASHARWSPLAGLRSVGQILSYQLPAIVAVCCVIMMTGSLRVADIIGVQGGTAGTPFEVGGWPWFWFVFRSPVTFLLFTLYIVATLAEGSRPHASVPEAEGPTPGATSPAHSGLRQTLFFFAEWANVLVMCGVASALFLGGWQIPGVSAAIVETRPGLQALGALLFLVKSWTLILGVVWLRWVLPRVRLDQMTSLCWRWLVPLALTAALLTGLWTVAQVPQATQLVISVVTFALSFLLLAHFTHRVRETLRSTRTQLHLNPFL
ncbi:complex I subunit 1/NuoH family protein [Chondromyces crocatus]|uniref:PDZ domain-containing protein n=1 Tax=Chondromyces crocatus TaxID=52 RepID=A0A0K1ETI4_CHOCO|nr:NADH-quinone oxidoreductase subunit H [Chondromyces crocatus]AKT43967.1 uncharacterized protein CMC5_082050 [Chondromyces crocatus]